MLLSQGSLFLDDTSSYSGKVRLALFANVAAKTVLASFIRMKRKCLVISINVQRSLRKQHNQVETLVKMFHYYEQHGFWGNPRVLRGLLGRAPTSFAAFVERYIRSQ